MHVKMQQNKQIERSRKKRWRDFWVHLRLQLFALTLAITSGAKGRGGRTAGLFAHAWLTCPGVVMSHEQRGSVWGKQQESRGTNPHPFGVVSKLGFG